MKAYEHVLAFALEHPWNITPAMLTVVASILARRIAGDEVNAAEVEAALVNRKNLPQPRQGTVAIIPVYGVIAPRMNLFSEMSGGTTYQRLSGQLRDAVNDRTVKQILLDVDSPGGNVAGNAELAREIMAARTKKPVIAQAQFTMASAAYQLAAAATEIVAAPSARVGGIGTFTIHNDLSDALKQLGVKRTFISAGGGKVDGNESEPLSDGARGRLQGAVDDAYNMFVTNVVRGRGADLTPERVRDEWQAHVYSAREAKAIGMIDAIATLEETLERLTDSPPANDSRAATEVHEHANKQLVAKLTQPRDTPQDAPRVSGQDRRAEADLERQTLEMQLTL